MIRDNTDRPWNRGGISCNSIFTMIRDNLFRPWNCGAISSNSDITMEMINPNTLMEILNNNATLNWRDISQHIISNYDSYSTPALEEYNLIDYTPIENEECIICFESDGDWCKLQCGHPFHVCCMKKCLESKSGCPVCKQNIYTAKNLIK